MSSVMPFTFNAVELYIATINEKPWTRPMEVCRALKYDSKTVDIVKNHCTRENIQHKYQLAAVLTLIGLGIQKN